jgi:3-oxoacyl-(acyl-carrier-protein) synthase
VAADSWSGLARLAQCAGVVLAARREGALTSAASVLAEVAGFAALREALQSGALSPAGGAAALGDACAAGEEGVRQSRAKLEEMQREVRRSAQLARAKEGPASG